MLVIDGRIIAAAVGVQGWLTIVEIDPALATTPLAFTPPVVVDTARTIAARGPLALAQLQTPDGKQLLVFALSTEGDLLFATRPTAGGDWSRLSALLSVRKLSPLGGVTAVSSPDLGVVVFAVAVDGTVVTARSRTGTTWTRLHSFAEAERPPAPLDPKALISNAFKGDPILQSVAADADRISRRRHARTDAVGSIQRALLLWDQDCLPNHHDDGKYGDETAGAVARFNRRDALAPPRTSSTTSDPPPCSPSTRSRPPRSADRSLNLNCDASGTGLLWALDDSGVLRAWRENCYAAWPPARDDLQQSHDECPG